jgi:galactose mutarotase-like enzyme
MALRLDEKGLHHRQSLSGPNRPWPFLLGWHPFFEATESARLTLQARRIALLDGNGFPRPFEGSDGADGLRRRDLRPTRIYDVVGCDRTIILEHEELSLTMAFSPLCRYVTVYAPADAPCIAIEPLSGLIDDGWSGGIDADLVVSLAVHGRDTCL